MEITQTLHGNLLILNLQGRVDAHTAKDFEAGLLPPIDRGQQQILVDCSRLDYISSAGLRVLLLAARKISAAGGKLALCSMKPSIKTVFDIAGFSSIFSIFAAPPEAITELTK